MGWRKLTTFAAALLLLAGGAPAGELTAGNDELSFKISSTPVPLQALAPTEFVVEVMDDHGRAITDFRVMVLQPRLAGSGKWATVKLTRVGNAYKGSYIFDAGGTYDLRISGLRTTTTKSFVLHRMPEQVEVADLPGI